MEEGMTLVLSSCPWYGTGPFLGWKALQGVYFNNHNRGYAAYLSSLCINAILETLHPTLTRSHSRDNKWIGMIRKKRQEGKPVILSTFPHHHMLFPPLSHTSVRRATSPLDRVTLKPLYPRFSPSSLGHMSPRQSTSSAIGTYKNDRDS